MRLLRQARRPMLPRHYAVAALLCLAVPSACAGSFQTPASIREAAVAALGVGSAGDAAVDSQLRMPQCGQPLRAVATSPRIVRVHCDDAPGWQLYVPVRGATPQRGTMPQTGQGGDAAPGDAAAGASLQRGDPVVLVSRAGGVEVRMSGRALGPAREGGSVTVENLGSHRIIRGRLVGAGLVEVAL
ncbi:flagella basal body P-ring formation protein FlgA [Lysobacter niastensis]|nr:flagella basal body P-ring formation protein FlgA [Lysobacter niastensis]